MKHYIITLRNGCIIRTNSRELMAILEPSTSEKLDTILKLLTDNGIILHIAEYEMDNNFQP